MLLKRGGEVNEFSKSVDPRQPALSAQNLYHMTKFMRLPAVSFFKGYFSIIVKSFSIIVKSEERLYDMIKAIIRRQNFRLVQFETICRRHFKVPIAINWKGVCLQNFKKIPFIPC